MKKISKPNELNNIISLNKSGNIYLANKNNSRNLLNSFYFEDFSSPKIVKNFIKNVEKQVRTSNEYKSYIGHLNKEIGLCHCSVFGNITDEDEVTLEYHHYPFTLYDIVEVVINDKVNRNIKFSTFDITNEVLNLHKNNQVGLVKLCKTAHELVHDEKIFIKLSSIFGKVDEFINIYLQSDSISDDLIEKYNKLIDMNNSEFDESILDLFKVTNNLSEEDMDNIQRDNIIIVN